MNALKFELNRAGVRDLLRGAEMSALCERLARQAAGTLGAGYEVTVQTGQNRVNAEIAAVTWDARRENARNNSILKAVGGVRCD